MTAITLYFQVHQPYRLRPYSVFDLGHNHMYEDGDSNLAIMRKVAECCYLPMNAILLEQLEKHDGAFRVSFSISGSALDQFEQYAPDVLESFKKLAGTGFVEFIGETYNHSLAFLFSQDEFTRQIKEHKARVQELFDIKPVTFRNTELIYSNEIALLAEKLGYRAILTEGADHVLGWRSANYVYQPSGCEKLRLLMRNHSFSDDIAFRFSSREWPGFPLTADKFASWLLELHKADNAGDVINMFMDYETFGEHHDRDTGIMEFMRALPDEILKHKVFSFKTPAQVVKTCKPVAVVDVPQYISWADAERDITAWIGNDMQLDAIESLYRLEPKISEVAREELCNVWRRLQTSDHFYYMSTKWFSDGEVHSYFNPYPSPYDAYINFMNVLADLELTLNEAILATEAGINPPSRRIVTDKTNGAARSAKQAQPKKSAPVAAGSASPGKTPQKTVATGSVKKNPAKKDRASAEAVLQS